MFSLISNAESRYKIQLCTVPRGTEQVLPFPVQASFWLSPDHVQRGHPCSVDSQGRSLPLSGERGEIVMSQIVIMQSHVEVKK